MSKHERMNVAGLTRAVSKQVILFNHISHMSEGSFKCKCGAP